MNDKLKKCLDAVNARITFEPKVAIVLGSGLGDYAEEMDIKATIDYSDIEGFPVSTVAGHKGRFIFGYIKEVPVVAMQGRVHYYEGYPMSDVVLPVRLMALMGAKYFILTNAAGGMNPSFMPGDLMMITDHITSFVPSPLIGPNIDELGTRFPDMSEVYSKQLRKKVKQAARNAQVSLCQGVYVQTTGPNYETPSEVRMYRNLGGDAVGMSTACEAMALNHMGVKVCGISCITNMASGISASPLNHEEVQQTADMAAASFKKLVTELIRLIGEDDDSCGCLY